MKTHVLDSNALLRFLVRNDGFEIVRQVFRTAVDAQASVLISVVNWGEVHYTIARRNGIKAANSTLENLGELPLAIVVADMEQTRAAAILKSSFGLPYADCFAAALTGKEGVLVTADAKDFKKVPWLRLMNLPPHARGKQ